MNINKSNLRQFNVQHYAGPSDKLPDTLPFGDYYFAEDTEILYKYNYQGVPISLGGGAKYQRVSAFSELIDGEKIGNLAYVSTKQGTAWLPGTNGGSYYPAGWYIWTGTIWKSDRNAIANQFQTNSNSLSQKSDIDHTHIKEDITDFSDDDYATNAQGGRADTALQEGDNISKLLNDELFLQPSDNVSSLVNDAGYLTGSLYKTKNSSYQALPEDEGISITTSGNTITLATTGMRQAQKVYIFNESSGDNNISGTINGVTGNIVIGSEDVIGLMFKNSSYNEMFKKKDDEVVATGGRTASYDEEFFSEDNIIFKNLFKSDLGNADDFFTQNIKLKHQGFVKDNISNISISSHYKEDIFISENKTKLSLTNLGCTDNAEIREADSGTNYGGASVITVTDPDALGNGETLGLFQWDLTGISDYAATENGNFVFNITNVSVLQARNLVFTLSTQSTSFFDENTVTFANQPSQGNLIGSITESIAANSNQINLEIELSVSQLNSCIGNFALFQVSRVDDLTDGSIQISSKEGAAFPKLNFNAEINY